NIQVHAHIHTLNEPKHKTPSQAKWTFHVHMHSHKLFRRTHTIQSDTLPVSMTSSNTPYPRTLHSLLSLSLSLALSLSLSLSFSLSASLSLSLRKVPEWDCRGRSGSFLWSSGGLKALNTDRLARLGTACYFLSVQL